MWALLVPVAYLVGCFPSAEVVARAHGVDITSAGSGNPGASNVTRVLGWRAGALVLVLDAVKGALATGCGLAVSGRPAGYVLGAAAIVGHVYPVTRRLRGGKGVATGLGAMLVLHPLVSAILGVVWFAISRISGKAAIASITIVTLLPAGVAVSARPGWEIAATIAVGALVMIRHASNLQRLWHRRELTLGSGRSPAPSTDPDVGWSTTFDLIEVRTDGSDTSPQDSLATASSALSFHEIGMTYPDGTHAIDEVTFSVRAGEFVTVVGPSGCGKSTLLRIASGLLEPTTGEVHIDRDHLGYVFQDPTLLPWRSVRQNVELLAELRGVERSERARLAGEAISMVGLDGFERHYPKSLSGGMRMRASLARTLTLRPPVLLFDEPFGAVDEITREHLNDQTQALFQAEGFAALFITHSISEAVFMSTRVLVMSARPGRIVAEFDVPFPYPRQPELRFDPEFAALSGAISKDLRGAHA